MDLFHGFRIRDVLTHSTSFEWAAALLLQSFKPNPEFAFLHHFWPQYRPKGERNLALSVTATATRHRPKIRFHRALCRSALGTASGSPFSIDPRQPSSAAGYELRLAFPAYSQWLYPSPLTCSSSCLVKKAVPIRTRDTTNMALSNLGGDSSLFQNGDRGLTFSDLRGHPHHDGAIAPYFMTSSWLSHQLELVVLQEFLDLTFKPCHRLSGGTIGGVTHYESGAGWYESPLRPAARGVPQNDGQGGVCNLVVG